jgi:thioredoxin-dependent peroxiredoxin
MTPGCTIEACNFTDLYTMLENVVILGLCPVLKKTLEIYKKHNLSITLISDEDKGVLHAYGAWGIKNNYGK